MPEVLLDFPSDEGKGVYYIHNTLIYIYIYVYIYIYHYVNINTSLLDAIRD